MTGRLLTIAACVTLAHALAHRVSAQGPERADLGRTEKLRILVDKVMQPEADWVTKEWMVRETAQAGFNVFSPRMGHDRLDEVRQVNAWCEEYGIYHMPWMRGTLTAPAGPEADGKRVLWASGSEQPLWSVCSDEFWDWTTQYIVEYARMNEENGRIIGVFLDYENYWPGGHGNLYDITYEDVILRKFAEARGIEVPELEPGGRKAWLEEQGLHDGFAAFQVQHWRQRCRRLREEVDQHDPAFQFCIYPAPGTPFMVQACYAEWATERAPLILADASVYGRPGGFLLQEQALGRNRQKLLDRMKTPQQAGIPFIYSGGIDPVVTGADPEFCGKNAVMISELTGGYWVFYEGPKYDGDHRDYFRWFTWANERIRAGQLQAWHEPRETPEEWVLNVFGQVGDGVELLAPEVTGRKLAFGKVTLRGENLLLLAAKRGQSVEVVLRNVPVARYQSDLAWDLRAADLTKIQSGLIAHDSEGTVSFTPEQDGIYLLGVSAGSCAYSVVSANVPVGLFAAEGVSFIYAAARLYFHVPAGAQEFTLTATGWGNETVRVNVFGPDGEKLATGQTTPAQQTVEVTVAVGDNAGKTWSLTTSRADEGVTEDYSIRLSGNVPSALALAPEHVFGLGQAE